MSATLTITREGSMGFELRRATQEITLDGAPVGSIERHATFTTEVPPGRHTLQIREGRYSSPAQTFEADDGGAVRFRCHGAMLWPRYVASLVVPSLGIALTRDP